MANALTHRVYARLGAVRVRLERDALVVSNPGGFVDGVSLDDLLTTEPRPRDPRLADALTRMGMVERTGRALDIVYRGLLRFGRPSPDCARSDACSVVLRLPTGDADVASLRLVLDEKGRRGGPLPTDTLIALAAPREHRRPGRAELAEIIHMTDKAALATLEGPAEAGPAEAHDTGRGRSYTLGASVYRQSGRPAEYIRQAGFDRLQQEHMVRAYVREHGEIRRRDVVEPCRVSADQARRLLARLVDEGAPTREGTGKATRYVPGEDG